LGLTDGTHTLTSTDSTALISTATPPGWPQLWHIVISSPTWELFTIFYGSAFEATDASGGLGNNLFGPNGNFDYLQGDRGTLIATPEPGTLKLLTAGMALVLFGWISLRLNRQLVQ
jgi:PEP-CTERM motif-containing protein